MRAGPFSPQKAISSSEGLWRSFRPLSFLAAASMVIGGAMDCRAQPEESIATRAASIEVRNLQMIPTDLSGFGSER